MNPEAFGKTLEEHWTQHFPMEFAEQIFGDKYDKG
jgi:hypothetical protein